MLDNNKATELSDDELGNVSGGCGEKKDYTHMFCKKCNWTIDWDGQHPPILDGYAGPCGGCGEYIIWPKYYINQKGETISYDSWYEEHACTE